jgi:hypothetical protein
VVKKDGLDVDNLVGMVVEYKSFLGVCKVEMGRGLGRLVALLVTVAVLGVQTVVNGRPVLVTKLGSTVSLASEPAALPNGMGRGLADTLLSSPLWC